MAQTVSGFPWLGHTNEQNPVLSEKPADGARKGSNTEDSSTDVVGQSTQNQVTQVATDKQKHNSKSRKRSASVKLSAPVIPQTREELDARLSYAPSRHLNVRTIPPWVRDAEEDDVIEEIDDGLLDSPHRALVAQHNSNPANTMRSGRQDRFTTSSGATRVEKTSRWITFARASAYPRENFHGEKVDTDWWNNNITDYSKPWLEGHEDEDNDGGRYGAFKSKRRGWYSRMMFVIMRNPFVPLAFRFTVILFAAIAIGLGASIYHEAGMIQRCEDESPNSRSQACQKTIGNQNIDYYRDPSALMAIIIDAIAIAYTFYITYDEYFSKPLGLRPTKAKVRLVLLDLFFIVFQSANLSLAFESLTVDDGACYVGSEPSTSYRFDKICNRAQALSSVLLVSLLAWLLTFSVSVLRLVERIHTR